MPEHLFVYGTLRAESLHRMARRLLTDAKLIGTGSAPGILYDFGYYPGATFAADAGSGVIGEVFALPEDGILLTELDVYEGTEDEDYHRVTVEVQLESGDRVTCWTYELCSVPERGRVIPGGDFIAHVRARESKA